MLLAQIHINNYLSLLIIKAWHFIFVPRKRIEYSLSAQTSFAISPVLSHAFPKYFSKLLCGCIKKKITSLWKFAVVPIGQTIHTMQCYTFLQTINCRLPNPNIIAKTTLITIDVEVSRLAIGFQKSLYHQTPAVPLHHPQFCVTHSTSTGCI